MVAGKRLTRVLRVYIEPDDIKLIEAVAKREQRSVSGMMRALFFDHVQLKHNDLTEEITQQAHNDS